MHVHSDVEIDIDKISVCLILTMGGNCSKSLRFSKSKILTSTEFYNSWFSSIGSPLCQIDGSASVFSNFTNM